MTAAAAWFAAVARGDAVALGALLAPEAELIDPNGHRVRGSTPVLRWLVDAAIPADARLHIGALSQRHGIAVATLTVVVPLADGSHSQEHGVMAVTVGRRGVRRVVIDD